MRSEITIDDAGERGPAVFPGGAVERERVFSSLHKRMFGTADPVTVGRFRIIERLGAGAMGIVYAAHDPVLDRRVALKLTHGASTDPEVAARADREARALARLRHPNVVTVHEIGTHGADRFIAMDLVAGITLREWMATPQPWRRIVEVFVQAARGLAAAHAASLVHRDFKPDNVLVEDGHARVVDFGFARAPAPATLQTHDEATPRGDVDVITRAGVIAGTPAYMAPEALRGDIDATSDQFAFCASLYEALYGVRPFAGTTTTALLEAIAAERLVAPTARRSVPAWLRRATVRGLAADPGARWPSMQAWLREVEKRRGRPRRTAMLAGIAGIVLGAAAVLASTDAPIDPCAGTQSAIDSVWNDARRDEIEQAFGTTRLPHARDAWTRADAALNAYATDWGRMRRDACEATRVRGEQSDNLLDARMRCLDRRRDDLAALASAFETPDEAIVSHAVAAGRNLPPIDDCADLDALARRSDRTFEEAPDEMYARLAVARAGVSTGKYEQALGDALVLTQEAVDAGYVELAAAAQHTVAALQDRSGDYAAAEASVRTAISIAERAGDDHMRARAQILLVSVLAQLHEASRAHDWATLTEASLTRLGDPPRMRALLAAALGNVLHVEARYEEALTSRREALKLREGFLDEDDPVLANSHFAIGTALEELGRHEEARAEHEAALALRRRALGDHHPQVARAHNALATVLMSQGRLEDAIQQLGRAIDIASLALGASHPFVGEACVNLGSAVAMGRDPKAAEPHFRRAIEIFAAAHGADSLSVATATMNLGRVLMFTDRAAEAIELIRRAGGIYADVLGPEHADNMYVYNNLAFAERQLGNPEAALAAAHRVREIGEAALSEDHVLVADAWQQIGEIQRELGDLELAVLAFEQAVGIHGRIESRPGTAAAAHYELARAYADTGRLPAARAEIALARAGFESDPIEHASRQAELEQLAARVR